MARASLPEDWAFAHAEHASPDRFLFAGNDLVIALGKDGLVPDLAKYLTCQMIALNEVFISPRSHQAPNTCCILKARKTINPFAG